METVNMEPLVIALLSARLEELKTKIMVGSDPSQFGLER